MSNKLSKKKLTVFPKYVFQDKSMKCFNVVTGLLVSTAVLCPLKSPAKMLTTVRARTDPPTISGKP